MTPLTVIQTRRALCIDCDQSDGEDGQDGDPLRCPLRYRRACDLNEALSRPEAKCPHPDKAKAEAWNKSLIEVRRGCGGVARAAERDLTPEQRAKLAERAAQSAANRMAAASQSGHQLRGMSRGTIVAYRQTGPRRSAQK